MTTAFTCPRCHITPTHTHTHTYLTHTCTTCTYTRTQTWRVYDCFLLWQALSNGDKWIRNTFHRKIGWWPNLPNYERKNLNYFIYSYRKLAKQEANASGSLWKSRKSSAIQTIINTSSDTLISFTKMLLKFIVSHILFLHNFQWG